MANSQPHRERIALDNLLRQGFRAYCPLIRRRVRHARRTQDVLRPLFPGYLFIDLDPNARWSPILSTFGVRTLVRCGKQLSSLPDEFVNSLKAREIEGATMRPASPYEIGQQVRIADGVFHGLVATIIDMDVRDRLVVLMNLLNRPTKVRLSARQVVPVWTMDRSGGMLSASAAKADWELG